MDHLCQVPPLGQDQWQLPGVRAKPTGRCWRWDTHPWHPALQGHAAPIVYMDFLGGNGPKSIPAHSCL